MKARYFAICSIILISLSAFASPGVQWHSWSPDIFAQAKTQNKPIFLNLEAVWCHWCHVMDAKTYVDPQVIELLNNNYLAVKVDHDARPDLANRYRKYGWPATIIFHPAGHEVAKRAGYIAPDSMVKMLNALKTPTTKITEQPLQQSKVSLNATRLSPALVTLLEERHKRAFDERLGGLLTAQKYLEGDSVEYALLLARSGNTSEAQRAKKTLAAASSLIDPVWGGAYQYSTGGVWTRPHHEKLMRTQARYLRIYARAYQQFGNPAYLTVIDNIRRYLKAFLMSPEGAFYVSQDADLVQGLQGNSYFAKSNEERLKLGIPRVDTHIYADANGAAIEGLAAVYLATRDTEALSEALMALNYVEKNLSNSEGYFQHTQTDTQGIYLSDNLAMARAYLQLYKATQAPRYLQESIRLAQFIDQTFRYATAGFASGTDDNTPIKSVPQIDENISLGRFGADLYKLSKSKFGKQIAERALGYLASPVIAKRRYTEEGILLLEEQLFPKNEKILQPGHPIPDCLRI